VSVDSIRKNTLLVNGGMDKVSAQSSNSERTRETKAARAVNWGTALVCADIGVDLAPR